MEELYIQPSIIPLKVTNMNQPAGNKAGSIEKSRIIENVCVLFIHEAPRLHKKYIEAIDFTLRDILSENDVMGGNPCTLSGDLR